MTRLEEILEKTLSFSFAPVAWVMRWLPSNEYEIFLNVNTSSEAALQRARHAFETDGTLRSQVVELSEASSVRAVVGSGFLSLNPTLVTIEAIRVTDTTCRVRIVGAAKEGLVRQRAAEKAVKRVVAETFPALG